jgi:hypothetical protein
MPLILIVNCFNNISLVLNYKVILYKSSIITFNIILKE